MTKDELMAAIDNFFGDTSRPASETKETLAEIADHAAMLAESIADDD